MVKSVYIGTILNHIRTIPNWRVHILIISMSRQILSGTEFQRQDSVLLNQTFLI